MLAANREVSESKFKEYVDESLKQIKPSVITKVIDCNRTYIRDWLKQQQQE